jgi:LysM repeat protein
MNRHGMLGAALLLGCGGLLAACAERPESSAPAYTVGPAQNSPVTAPASLGPQSAGEQGKTRYIVVKAGQSLGGIAEAYHVPKDAIIAANHLTAPYNLKTGTRLAIPLAALQARTPRVSSLKAASSAPAPANSGHAARRVGATANSDHAAPQVSTASRHRKVRHAEPEVIPLDDPAPAQAGTLAPPPEPGSAGRLN